MVCKLGGRSMEAVFLEHEENVGGGEGVVGLYGSLTTDSMAEVLADWPDFNASSILLDVGCGIGRPQMQALVQYGVSCSVGVEMDCIKCNKAVAFIERVAKDAALDASGVRILHRSSSKLTTLEPCTHLYLCWQGWHANDKAKMGALVKESASVFCVCMVQHSRDTLRDVQALVSAGWPPLQLVKSRQVHLLQSRETLRAHTYLVLGRSVGLGAPTRVRCTTGLMSVLPHKGAGEGRSLRCRKGKEEQPAAG